MTGSKMTSKTDVVRLHATGDFVWDGQDEDERPLTGEVMQAAVETYRRRRGRPTGGTKTMTTIRLDRDILEAFRAHGAGWQTRINMALREWLTTHAPTPPTSTG